MSFIDELRTARASRIAVMHEFLAQYDPSKKRIHAFFEGHEDVAFFSPFIEQSAGSGFRLFPYRCEGKEKVYDTFAGVMAKVPNAKNVLFFVDKDVDDVLGTPWPTDPRIFVTDVYSVENYLVSPVVLSRLIRDCVRSSKVAFDERVVFEQFDKQLKRFYRAVVPVMAWIIAVRRAGQRPNLGSLNLRDLFSVSDSCVVSSSTGARHATLVRCCLGGAAPRIGSIAPIARELKRIAPKRIVRGKFEIWFFVEFWKKTVAQLTRLAIEGGGKIDVKVQVDYGSCLMQLSRYVEVPGSLKLFLSAHLAAQSDGRSQIQPQPATESWFKRALKRITF